jgi:tetratricopeptide (TPR) repeat protein
MALFSLSLRSYREQQNQAGIAMVLNSLGQAYLEGEQLDEAASHFAESLQLRSTMGDMRGVAASLEGCVMLALKREESLRAAQLWGAAEALRTRLKAPLAPLEQPAYDTALATLREALGTAQFSAALTTGAALPVEAAVALAIG